ncbi:sugar phosphate isomerase/epimerase [Gimesia chilikensis]|uniref:sugar phosphate isomerase/epimerase family protein n=1 Tax=Gimesia chilikensis TaxID=2605989 RepID=UPI0011EDEF02|nr:TIM barrel protein [Gimesia chilikensis]KAA0140164.1 sugar phosphate isomerase/epimerase [Gimesia chilikensis]
MKFSRRAFLQAGSGALAIPLLDRRSIKADSGQKAKAAPSLERALGITTSSFSGHLSPRAAKGKISLLDLPRMLREELGMTVIDLNTSTVSVTDGKYLEQLRNAADRVGCVLTNLKMNQGKLDMNSPDQATRAHALKTYKASIDVASELGLKWARPLPRTQRPDMQIHIDSYRELCDYGAERNVQLLVENYGWMQNDPESVVKLVKAIGHQVAACPDTGNWDSDELRYAGLAKTFPIAVTCDFKARAIGPRGEHPLYDLKRCFEIGWQAGFRGPWCFEHANKDQGQLWKELGMLRDMLQTWMKEAAQEPADS